MIRKTDLESFGNRTAALSVAMLARVSQSIFFFPLQRTEYLRVVVGKRHCERGYGVPWRYGRQNGDGNELNLCILEWIRLDNIWLEATNPREVNERS